MTMVRPLSEAPGWMTRSGVPWRPGALVVVVLALFFSSGGAARGQSVEELIRDLSSADAARRAKAVEGLAEAGAAVAPRLVRVAADASTDDVRLAALDALSRNSMAYAYSYVFWEALAGEDDDARARRVVWDGLIRVGDAFIAVGEVGAASDHYCDLLESVADSREHSAVIRGLGRASRRRAAEEVFRALLDDDAVVRTAAFAAVADLRWGQARPYLERTLKTAEPPLLVGLLGSLSRRTEPEAAVMVKRFLDHEEPSVRTAAKRASARHAGFVTEWWVLGPFSGPDGSLFQKDIIPVPKVRPRDAPEVKVDGRTLRWRRLFAAESNGTIDLSDLTGGLEPRPAAVAYACAEVVTEKAQRVRLLWGGDDVLALWLNGERIHAAEGAREPRVEERAIEAELTGGTHRIVVKVRNERGAWAFSLRVTDEGGAPVILFPPADEKRG